MSHFDSYEAYARCMDRLIADPAFMAWQQKNLASGLSSWVRSNLAREFRSEVCRCRPSGMVVSFDAAVDGTGSGMRVPK
jgi:hypothetical protein